MPDDPILLLKWRRLPAEIEAGGINGSTIQILRGSIRVCEGKI